MKRLFYFMVMILLMAGFSGCLSEIKKSPMGGDEIYSDNKDLELLIGQTIQLTASPEEFVFEWTSSHPNIVTVTNTGLVEAVGVGDADITIRSGNLKLVVHISVGSKMPKLATRFGNGLLVRWDTVQSPALILHELTYLDRDGVEKIATFDARIDSAFVEDFASQLQVASIYYYKNDTIRVRPLRYNNTKNAATTIELVGGQMDIRNFDIGREVGWHDETPENTLKDSYREQIGEKGCAVDIAPDKYVGDLSAGEWLSYTLHVKSSGSFVIDVNALVIAGDSTVFKFVLDEGTDTLSYTIFKTEGEVNYKWLKSKALQQPSFYMTPGLHKFKILFTDNNVRIKNIRLTPRSVVGGSNLPTLQYLFEFENDLPKASIGSDNLVFGDQSSPPQPIDITGRVVAANEPPYDGAAVKIPQNVTVKIPNPAYNGEAMTKYTMMWDIRIPTQGRWYTLLHTGENSRSGDAHFFLRSSDNSLGRGNYGGSSKALAADRWYRVVLCVDATSSDSAKYTIYLDGEPYFENPWMASGSNYSMMGLKSHFYIFSDNDGEDQELDCAGFAFWADRYLSATQVAALGKIKYPETEPLGVTKAIRFGNGVLAYFEDFWRFNYNAQYVAQNGGSWTYYSNKLSPETFYPNCYTGLRVQSVQPNGKLSNPVFFSDSQYTADIAMSVSDTGTTIIPAVNFDGGGEGVGYYEGNTGRDGGNSYRIDVIGEKTSYVDMEGDRNGDPFRDMNISHTVAGEWLQYSVYVRKAGKYYLDISNSVNGEGVKTYFTVNGEGMPIVRYPNQGNWSAYRWYHEATGTTCQSVVTLKQGLNVIKLNMLTGGFNLKGFRLKPFGLITPAPLGIYKATQFGNGLSISFIDIACIGKYTVTYTNKSNLTKTVDIIKPSALIADYKSNLTIKAGTQVIPFDVSTILDKTRTLSTGGTLDIAAVDFDGGRGIGYSTTRIGDDEYRSSIADTDCGLLTEGSGEAANRNIGTMTIGEWVQYSVDVETAGDYSVDVFIAAAKNDAKYSLTVNGVKTASFPVPNNGGYANYRWNSTVAPCTPVVRLKTGINTIRLHVEGNAVYNDQPYNLKTIRLSPANHVPLGLTYATKFGNGLAVTFLDNPCVNYTLEYTNTSGTAASKSITSETTMPVFIADYGSGLTVKLTSTGAIIPFDESIIIDKTRTLATNGTLEIYAADFDGGSDGMGHHKEQFIGSENKYRTEYLHDLSSQVPIYGTGNDPANLVVGSMHYGEWLQYTFNAESEGDYAVDIMVGVRYASVSYSLTVNDTKTASYPLVNNGNYNDFQWHSTRKPCMPIVHVKRGINTLVYHVDGLGDASQLKRLKLLHITTLPEPLGVTKATQFGNGLLVSFSDNACVNYTLEYTNTNNQTVSMSISQSDEFFMISDYKSDLLARAAGFSIVTPEIKSIRHTISATNPTIIPIVDYDYGGEGVAFHDRTARPTSSYRSNLGDNSLDVGIEGSGEPTNMNIGYVNDDEWLQYTVYAEAAGDYAFDFNISVNNDNAKYALTVNGVKTADYNLGHHNTGGWGNYYWFHRYWAETRPVVHLNEGANTVRIHIIGGDYNMKSFRFDNVLSLPYMTTGWTAASRNGNHGWGASGGQPEKVLDGDQRSGWHSATSSAPLPQCLVVDMKETKAIDHLCLLYMFNGITSNKWIYLNNVKVYLTDTPDVVPDIEQASWGAAVADVTIDLFSASNNGKDAGSEVTRIDLASGSSGRYLILYFPNSRANTYISFMELEVYGQ